MLSAHDPDGVGGQCFPRRAERRAVAAQYGAGARVVEPGETVVGVVGFGDGDPAVGVGGGSEDEQSGAGAADGEEPGTDAGTKRLAVIVSGRRAGPVGHPCRILPGAGAVVTSEPGVGIRRDSI